MYIFRTTSVGACNRGAAPCRDPATRRPPSFLLSKGLQLATLRTSRLKALGKIGFRAGDWLSYQEAVKQSTKMLRMTSISCNCVNCIPKMRNLVGLTMDQLKMSNKAYKCTVWIALNGYINKDCALFAGILGKIQSPILTAHIPYLEKPSLIIQFSTYSNLTWAMRFIKQNYTQHGFFAEEIC